ncbi:GerW family sporulation protein [Tepidibacter thalassicus]|uniref:Sporulation protein YtfJ n=1 Tax=Tepidibacter thalassicus DSM 15285 TaxID=1123350 RepID=A0A1M5PYT2_9FIRM|nr:GerW family sporulation protein [Tepidibacter thalassicus]SHH06619.1 sporulation protein YtfJ [Tepidibacter thalassicus DSM 15285]
MNEQQHPIESLMKTTMENMKEMIDVNTIVGDPVETSNGSVLIPISKLSFGFASGGGEYNKGQGSKENEINETYPFAGGAGAGITVQPVAFMVVDNNETKLMYIDQNANMLDNILNKTPKLMENIHEMFNGKSKNKKLESNHNNNENNSNQN